MNRQLRRRLKRKGLRPRAIALYAHLHGHCFFGPTCWPSQALLGERMGISQPLVNALCQELRDAGVLTWEKEHKRGSLYPCNVYRLRYWSRPKIAGTMRVLRARKRSNSGCSDTKGQSRRALAPERDERHRDQPSGKGHGSLSADVRRTTSAGYVTTASGCGRENDFRRFCMPPARRLSAAPDLTHQDLVAELERKDEIIRKYAISETKNGEEISGLHEAVRTLGKENARLKGRLTRQDNESAKLEQVELVVECWRRHRPKASKAFGKPGSKSFAVIEKALVLMADEDGGAVRACCEAIDGLHLAPYQEFDRWFAVDGPKRTLRNSVEHALGDEARIERCRTVAARASNVSLDAKFRAYEVSGQVHSAWARVLMGELWTQPEDVSVVVDGLVVRP